MINSREDLEKIKGTPEYNQFIELLKSTLFHLVKDDVEKKWKVVEKNETTEKFGFTRSEFGVVKPPATPKYVEEVVPLPSSVSMRQARLALLAAGLLDAVESTIAAMTGEAGQAARIEWEYATTVERNSEWVANLASALGITNEQLDALFMNASEL